MKKKLALILSILCCAQSSMQAFSVRSALNVITYPFAATYRGIKKAAPRVARFCKNHPEDALMIGIITAALIVAATSKYQEIGPARNWFHPEWNNPNPSKRNNLDPKRNNPNPLLGNSKYVAAAAHHKAKSLAALQMLRDQGVKVDEKVAEHHCMICLENQYMALRCGHFVCEGCWERYKLTEANSYYKPDGTTKCPGCGEASNKHERCPQCRRIHADRYDLTEI